MPKILFIAATKMEAECIKKALGDLYPVVVSGIGGLSTTIATIDALSRYKVDMAVQIGIAGAVSNKIAVGSVVIVKEDYTADLGAYRAESQTFVPFTTEHYFSDFRHEGYQRVVARSVTTATTPILIGDSAEIETMEGAHFMAAAKYKGVEAVQLRAISNNVNDRREEWKVKEALLELELAVKEIFEL